MAADQLAESFDDALIEFRSREQAVCVQRPKQRRGYSL
jgi:hypothetical protein